MRNQMFRRRFMLRAMLWLTDKFATDIELDDYPALARGTGSEGATCSSPV